jgi:two-component SAPR family response regulator
MDMSNLNDRLRTFQHGRIVDMYIIVNADIFTYVIEFENSRRLEIDLDLTYTVAHVEATCCEEYILSMEHSCQPVRTERFREFIGKNVNIIEISCEDVLSEQADGFDFHLLAVTEEDHFQYDFVSWPTRDATPILRFKYITDDTYILFTRGW